MLINLLSLVSYSTVYKTGEFTTVLFCYGQWKVHVVQLLDFI